MRLYTSLIICIFFLFPRISVSQEKYVAAPTRILFIFDYSFSMGWKWEKERKIDVARRIIIKITDSLDNLPNIQMALRLYGHQKPAPPIDCSDTKLEVPFAYKNAANIKNKLMAFQPKGTTPIARSLEQSINDFPPCEDCKNIIVLITDGIEACTGDPCAIAIKLKEKGISIRPYIIGIGADADLKNAFNCVGDYFDANKEHDFEEALKKIVIREVVTPTTAQVNLLDAFGKPTESNVNMTFYNVKNPQNYFNIIHTFNSYGNPDTFKIDAAVTYNIVVQTIPQVFLMNFKPVKGIHNVITIGSPQGMLTINQQNGGNEYTGYRYLIRKAGDPKTLNVQEFFKPEKYIVGKYDLELLTLPRIYLTGIEIKQGENKIVTIPQPGVATLLIPSEGYGSLYLAQKNGLSWIYNINGTTREILNLQPGKYLAIYRPKNAKSINFTIKKEFEIFSGRSVFVQF